MSHGIGGQMPNTSDILGMEGEIARDSVRLLLFQKSVVRICECEMCAKPVRRRW
jgi:hypothetical protein